VALSSYLDKIRSSTTAPRSSSSQQTSLSPTLASSRIVSISITHKHCAISILSPTSCIFPSRRLQTAVLHPAVTRRCKHGAVTVLFRQDGLFSRRKRPTRLVGLLASTPLSHLPFQRRLLDMSQACPRPRCLSRQVCLHPRPRDGPIAGCRPAMVIWPGAGPNHPAGVAPPSFQVTGSAGRNKQVGFRLGNLGRFAEGVLVCVTWQQLLSAWSSSCTAPIPMAQLASMMQAGKFALPLPPTSHSPTSDAAASGPHRGVLPDIHCTAGRQSPAATSLGDR
jgi:hypothetical protein